MGGRFGLLEGDPTRDRENLRMGPGLTHEGQRHSGDQFKPFQKGSIDRMGRSRIDILLHHHHKIWNHPGRGLVRHTREDKSRQEYSDDQGGFRCLHDGCL